MLKRFFGKQNTKQAPVESAPSRPGDRMPTEPAVQADAGPRILGVVIAGKSVFVTTTSALIVLDLGTGEKRSDWTSELKPLGPPTTDGSSVFYVGQADGSCQVVAVDATWGAERWRSEPMETLRPERSTVASPFGRLVFVSSSIGILGFDTDTGKQTSGILMDDSLRTWGMDGYQHAVARGIYPLWNPDPGSAEGLAGLALPVDGVEQLAHRHFRWNVQQQLCRQTPPVITRAGVVFSFGTNGTIGCTNVASGKGIVKVPSEVICPGRGEIAVQASDQMLFVAAEGTMHAYNIAALQEVWEKELDVQEHDVIGIAADGQTVIVNGPDNFMISLDAVSGGIRWVGQCHPSTGAGGFVPVGDDRFLVYSKSVASDGGRVTPEIELREIAQGNGVWSATIDVESSPFGVEM